VTLDGKPDLVSIGYGGNEGMAGAITTLVNVFPRNQSPDCSFASARFLGSGSDGLVAIGIDGIVDPDGDPISTEILSITQDEPVTDEGAGSTCPDAVIDGGMARVRLESSVMGNGRTYAIHYVARDPRGGETEGVGYLCVPAAGYAVCTDDGQSFASISCGLSQVPLQPASPLVLEYGIARASGRTIDFAVGMPGKATGKLAIFDVSGRRITEFDLACEGPCRRTVRWQADGTAPGVYFSRLQSPYGTRTRTVVLHH
jgi:hypothetical protein